MMKSLTRHPKNPILTRHDIHDIEPHFSDVTSVFNPGAIKYGDKYLLMLRVQSRSRETFLVMAESMNGIDFRVENKIVDFKGIGKVKERIYHIYDPRITKLGSMYYIIFAMDMEGSCQLGLGKTVDFRNFDFMGIVSNEDIRNGVLFPEKVQGKYLRMDRPNKSVLDNGPRSGSTIWLSESDNLLDWTPLAPVIEGRFHYWDEFVGSGPPPVKTRDGWLHIYHGIAGHFGSTNIYQAGVVILDLKDPSKVIGRSRGNILEPRELYELVGQVPNVVFPSGLIIEEYDAEGFALQGSEAKIYYGAADTVVGLATTSIKDLIDCCDLQK
jgi:beta-1,4-mannooligosaccharide/beta-1,4-mannosyl-N-acetylglucosamine phosphorylase